MYCVDRTQIAGRPSISQRSITIDPSNERCRGCSSLGAKQPLIYEAPLSKKVTESQNQF